MQKIPMYQQSYEARKRKYIMIKAKFPDRIPVIITKGSCDLPEINSCSFLVTDSSTFSKLLISVMNEIKKNSEEDYISSVTLLVNNKYSPPSNMTLSEIHEKYKSDDGFLYVTYIKESVFG